MGRLLLLLLFAVPAFAGTTPLCGTQDDTVAVQAVINAIPAAGGRLDLPAGFCRVSGLIATNRDGLTIQGQGSGSVLVPIQAGQNIIDLTGSTMTTLRDFRICGMCSGVVAATGILAAQMDGNYRSDVVRIDGVRVDGAFAIAALYVLGVASSYVSASQFYNYQPGGMTVVLTGNNFLGASSGSVPIDTTNSHMPTDWTFTQTEIHNLGGGWALWVGGAQSIRFYGGNMASQHPIASFNSVSGYTPNWIIMDGVTFYSDTGVNPPCAVSGSISGVMFRANQATMPLTGC